MTRDALEARSTQLLLAWLCQIRQPTNLGDGNFLPSRLETVIEHPEWQGPTDSLIRHALELERLCVQDGKL